MAKRITFTQAVVGVLAVGALAHSFGRAYVTLGRPGSGPGWSEAGMYPPCQATGWVQFVNVVPQRVDSANRLQDCPL